MGCPMSARYLFHLSLLIVACAFALAVSGAVVETAPAAQGAPTTSAQAPGAELVGQATCMAR